MYGKIEDGKFIAAPNNKSVKHEENKTIIEYYSKEELKEMGFKEVLTGGGEGRPGKGMRPSFTHEDKGDYIIRRMNWVAKQQA